MKLLDAFNDAGRTVVIITHEEEVARFAKRIVRVSNQPAIVSVDLTDLTYMTAPE